MVLKKLENWARNDIWAFDIFSEPLPKRCTTLKQSQGSVNKDSRPQRSFPISSLKPQKRIQTLLMKETYWQHIFYLWSTETKESSSNRFCNSAILIPERWVSVEEPWSTDVCQKRLHVYAFCMGNSWAVRPWGKRFSLCLKFSLSAAISKKTLILARVKELTLIFSPWNFSSWLGTPSCWSTWVITCPPAGFARDSGTGYNKCVNQVTCCRSHSWGRKSQPYGSISPVMPSITA